MSFEYEGMSKTRSESEDSGDDSSVSICCVVSSWRASSPPAAEAVAKSVLAINALAAVRQWLT